MAGTSEDAAGFHSEAGFRSGLRIWLGIAAMQWKRGAASVLGIDLSEKMLDQAQKINQPAGVEYLRCALEDYAYPAETYDIVISSLTLHYIEDLSALFRKVAQTLRTGGEFIFSMEHPIFTAEGSQQWLDQTSPVRYGGTRYFGRPRGIRFFWARRS